MSGILDFTGQRGNYFHFLQPSAPHMGDLWKACIKSINFHLLRVIRNACLTFEEFDTVLCQVEACLNSLPLCLLSNEPMDLQILTPGHFLFGSSMLSPPDPNLLSLSANRLSRWKRVQHFTQPVWKRWPTDYLGTLQQRTKWKLCCPIWLSAVLFSSCRTIFLHLYGRTAS
ncbi:hypothetical protein PR048_005465 [Dryococelus australis]|uniref:DUF5641 domain-containing protein n=1 Tax=Dryococelus australis TaxID=614101 RepID=A0ABQ9I9C0_9NEOP|nr:hypothetical protein PR048_005465 [Dryococelus australis]